MGWNSLLLQGEERSQALAISSGQLKTSKVVKSLEAAMEFASN